MCGACVQVCSLKRSEALESEVDLPNSSWLNPGEVSMHSIDPSIVAIVVKMQGDSLG